MSSGHRLPSWTGQFLFSALLSGSMSFLVSGVATVRAVGLVPEFVSIWMSAWMTSWPVAFAAVSVLAPIVRRIVGLLVAPTHSVSSKSIEPAPRTGA